MSQGDTNVPNANVIDLDSYEELLDRYGCMIKALEKEMAKIEKLKNKNSFIKNTYEQQKHLLYVTTYSNEELKLAHEELSVAQHNLVTWYKTMLFSLKSFPMKRLKLVRAHHMGQMINHIMLLTLVM